MSTEAQKEASRKWYAANKDAAKERMRAYYEANREKCAASHKQWKSRNPGRVKELAKEYRERSDKDKMYTAQRAWLEKNAAHVKAREKARRITPKYMAMNAASAASRRRARSTWADKSCVEAIYELARIYTVTLGREFHVDHEIPLRSKLVCGLHNEHNLQILPAKENLQKRNKFRII